MPDHPHPPRAAEERISDERLASLLAAYSKMSFEKSYKEIANALRELQSRRAAPERAAVIEECARVAETFGRVMEGMYLGAEGADRRMAANFECAAQAAKDITERIRSLATPDTGTGEPRK